MTRRALIVGVNHYDDGKIQHLRGAERDATEMMEVLTKFGQFEVSDFLVGPRATGDALRKGISDLLWKETNDDTVLFYFSGHGFQDSYGCGYLAPCDMIYTEPLVHGFAMHELKRLALWARESGRKQNVILILDCCHSGIFDAASRGQAAPVNPAEAVLHDLNDTSTGVFAFSSSTSDDISRESNEGRHELGTEESETDRNDHFHGLFTFRMLEGLAGAAQGKDEWISVESLHDYLFNKKWGEYSEKWRFYGVKTENIGNIQLARPENFKRLNETLDKIQNDLASDRYYPRIQAAMSFCTTAHQFPKYERVGKLRLDVESKILECKSAGTQWLYDKKLDYLNIIDVYSNLETETASLSLGMIEKYNKGTLKKIITLFLVIDGNHDENYFMHFLTHVMPAQEIMKSRRLDPQVLNA